MKLILRSSRCFRKESNVVGSADGASVGTGRMPGARGRAHELQHGLHRRTQCDLPGVLVGESRGDVRAGTGCGVPEIRRYVFGWAADGTAYTVVPIPFARQH